MKPIKQFANETNWNTKDLKKLCEKVIRHEGSCGQAIWIRTHHMLSDSCISGRAGLNRPWIIMRVSKTKIATHKYNHETKKIEHSERDAKFRVRQFALVLMHEIGHTRGLLHKDMLPTGKMDAEFVEGMVVKPGRS